MKLIVDRYLKCRNLGHLMYEYSDGGTSKKALRWILVMSPLLSEVMISSENQEVCPHKKFIWQGKTWIIASGILCVHWWRVWYEIMSVIEELPFNMKVAA